MSIVIQPGLVKCEVAVKDSDMCLQNSEGWENTSTCAENDAKCDDWPKDMYRCCPDTCPYKEPFTESVCQNVDQSKKGECAYPFVAKTNECYNNSRIGNSSLKHKDMAISRSVFRYKISFPQNVKIIFLGWTFCSLAKKDSDMCLQDTEKWGEVVNGKFKYTCAKSSQLCDSWAKDMRRCCPETCLNSEKFTEKVCNDVQEKNGTCMYPFHAKLEECEKGTKLKVKKIKIFKWYF